MKEFGARKSLRFIPTHHIARSLGPNKSLAFQFFHAISGCGMMSSLSGKARNVFLTCGHAWMRLPHYSKTCHLLQHHTKSKIVNYNYLSSLWKDYIQKLATQKKCMRQEEFSFPGIRERDQEHLTYQRGTKTILPSDQSFNLQSGQRQKSLCKDLDCWDACQNGVGKE